MCVVIVEAGINVVRAPRYPYPGLIGLIEASLFSVKCRVKSWKEEESVRMREGEREREREDERRGWAGMRDDRDRGYVSMRVRYARRLHAS